MEEKIVMIRNGELEVGTWDLSIGFEQDHRHLKRLIEKYKNEFDEMGMVAFRRQRKTGKKGSQIDEFILNEEQAMYLTTLMQNNDRVRKFKRILVNQFLFQRKLLLTLKNLHENSEWLEKRRTGKTERRLETDKIQKFVTYAIEQGSKSAEKYYMAISKMENHALFCLDYLEQKFPNLRDAVNTRSLDALMMADRIVGRALEEGMEKMMHYKEIYKLAKERVEIFGNSIGKTPLELALQENLKERLPIA